LCQTAGAKPKTSGAIAPLLRRRTATAMQSLASTALSSISLKTLAAHEARENEVRLE